MVNNFFNLCILYQYKIIIIFNKIKNDKFSYKDQLSFNCLRDGNLFYQYISEVSLKKSHKYTSPQ